MVVGKDVIVVEEQEVTKLQVLPFMETDGDVPSHCLTPSPPPSLSRQPSIDRFQQPVTIHSIIAETTSDVSAQ